MKLIVDPGQEDKLVDLYMDSWIQDYKDEKNLAYKVIVAPCSLGVSPKKHRPHMATHQNQNWTIWNLWLIQFLQKIIWLDRDYLL